MYLFYYLFVFILNFFYFFLQVFKLLMQMSNLLSSSRIFLVINPGWWSNVSLITNTIEISAFSKALNHLHSKSKIKFYIIRNQETTNFLDNILLKYKYKGKGEGLRMIIGTLAGVIGIADIIYLVKTIKKYKQLSRLLQRLTQKCMSVEDVINMLKNQTGNVSIPVIVKGWVKARPQDKDSIVSAITSIPIYESDRLRQYAFERIPYRSILKKATSVRPKNFESISFQLQDLNSSARLSIESLKNTDISGVLSQFKTFETQNASFRDKFSRKLKKLFNTLMFLSPFKFPIKLGQKISYYTLMNDHFTYIVGQATKKANGQPQIKNPLYLTKQLSFLITKIKQSIQLHKYLLCIYIMIQVIFLFYALKWIYNIWGKKLKIFQSDIDEEQQQNVPFEQTCIICYSSARSVIFKPCKHYGVCYACYKRIGREKVCPLCKERIQGIIHVVKK